MSTFAKWVLVIVSFVFAWQRVAGVDGKVFQAFAHLWEGGLILSQVTIILLRNSIIDSAIPAVKRWFFLLLGAAAFLGAVEAFCFFRPSGQETLPQPRMVLRNCRCSVRCGIPCVCDPGACYCGASCFCEIPGKFCKIAGRNAIERPAGKPHQMGKECCD